MDVPCCESILCVPHMCMQLGGEPSLDANEWLKVVGEVQDTVGQLQAVKGKLEGLKFEVGVEKEGGDGCGCKGSDGDHGPGGWREASACVDRIGVMVEEVEEVDRLHKYLTWLRHVQQLR